MSRPLLLFASRHESVASALRQQFELFIPTCKLPHRVEHVGFSSCTELFAALDAIPPEQLLNTMLVFDISAEEEGTLDVRNIHGEWGVATQLILSYPELYIVFFETALPQPVRSIDLSKHEKIREYHYVEDGSLLKLHNLIRFHADEFRALFDATGLRSLIVKDLLTESGDERVGMYQLLSKSRFEHAAVCADEEIPFVYLNGYAAYSAGFRTWLLCTQKEFRRHLPARTPAKDRSADGLQGAPARSSGSIAGYVRTFLRWLRPPVMEQPMFGAVLSDWELAYPDHIGPVPKDSLLLSTDFKTNDKVIIISSYQQADEKKTWKDFGELPEIVRLPKPYGGIFSLLSRGKNLKRNALGLRSQQTWRDIKTQTTARRREDSRHSAPYARNLVARRLLMRARLINSSATKENTEAWVHMALLASTAKEILGQQSRTTAYEALALQHEAEVNAEMSFFGISTKLEVKRRLKKLEQESLLTQSGVYGSWKARREHENSRLNFLLRAVNSLRLRFMEYEQVKATEECVHRLARYHRRLGSLSFTSLLPAFLSPVFGSALWATWGYPEFATKAGTSFWRLFYLSVFWVVIFTAGYSALLARHPNLNTPEKQVGQYELAAWHSVFTFISLQPGMKEVDELTDPKSADDTVPTWGGLPDWSRRYRILVLVELGVAYLHLGLLISILYRRVTKRAP